MTLEHDVRDLEQLVSQLAADVTRIDNRVNADRLGELAKAVDQVTQSSNRLYADVKGSLDRLYALECRFAELERVIDEGKS